jgi:hypothetical protein
MGSIISAIGTAAPENRFPQKEILRFMIEAHQLGPTDAQRLEKLYNRLSPFGVNRLWGLAGQLFIFW